MNDKAIECLRLGVKMRRAQTAFFRSNERSEREKALALARKLEREFDQMSKYLIALAEAPKSG